MLRQQLAPVHAIGHGKAIHARVARHLHVIGGIAHHQRPVRLQTELFQNIFQHSWMRFGKGLVGATRGAEKMRGAGIAQYAVQPAARLAGRNRQQVALRRQIFQARAHAGEELHAGLVEVQEVLAVTLHHLRARSAVDLRQQRRHRFIQPQADDMADGVLARIGRAGVFERGGEAAHDLGDGIHERSVPVENNQFMSVHGTGVAAKKKVRREAGLQCPLYNRSAGA